MFSSRYIGLRGFMFLSLFLVLASPVGRASALDDYVSAPDPSFKWEIASQLSFPGTGSLYEINLTSQTWQGLTWTHHLRLLVPERLDYPNSALLFITGSGSGEEELSYMLEISKILRTPLAILHDIPNQPLFGGLYEDEIIAYTFAKFIETGDPTWPLLLPMTKAAVRAMDTIQELGREKLNLDISGFVVTGASKRGWTTWLVAAVDPRVRGIAPMVYDNLNLPRQMKHQVETWGTYSEQIEDYTRLDLPHLLSTEAGEELSSIVDPYAYRERLTMPKLIIQGTNDRYWPVDALNIYYDDLLGEKHILYIPNAGHELGDYERILRDLALFYIRSVGAIQLPQLNWKLDSTPGRLKLTVGGIPPAAKVNFWTAWSPTRDFRNAVWNKTTVEGGVSISNALEAPKSGWRAFFGEAIYLVAGQEVSLCTQIYLIPAE